jgi:hypothetical protein
LAWIRLAPTFKTPLAHKLQLLPTASNAASFDAKASVTALDPAGAHEGCVAAREWPVAVITLVECTQCSSNCSCLCLMTVFIEVDDGFFQGILTTADSVIQFETTPVFTEVQVMLK